MAEITSNITSNANVTRLLLEAPKLHPSIIYWVDTICTSRACTTGGIVANSRLTAESRSSRLDSSPAATGTLGVAEICSSC
mmetsp:Transcript_4164/g.6946  ORF Transcript_4164/g.6946 Transcript_4164/m.6946 type:complete len:81 (+) Transcript_4164:431-673(+)